jgi:hypothetical protein
MSCRLVFKRYNSTADLWRAVDNHHWLAAAGLPVPQLIKIEATTGSLGFERVEGRHATSITDLEQVATQLGHWHRRLARGSLASETGSPSLRRIEPFLPSREQPLRTLQVPGRLIDASKIGAVAALAGQSPTSVYKDVNVRNVLVGEGEIHHVDFDDLSLAPAGYDLAKLLVSWAMTHGSRPPIESLLSTYNGAADRGFCDPDAFAVWIEIHHVLTSRYVNGGSYRYLWSLVRTAEDERRAILALAS